MDFRNGTPQSQQSTTICTIDYVANDMSAEAVTHTGGAGLSSTSTRTIIIDAAAASTFQ